MCVFHRENCKKEFDTQSENGNDMQVFDNVNKTVRDDLAITIQKGSKLSITAACFSIYAHLKRSIMGREVVVAITDGKLDSAHGSRYFTASLTICVTNECW